MKILLVEDDDAMVGVLTRTLTDHHFVVDAVKDGENGWTYGSTFEYDLIVLDIMLPKLDGITLCQRLRTEGYTTPILLLTAQDTSTAKVKGLDAGADDYVVKPFDMAELIARIRALLRRGSTNPFPLLVWGDLLLNPSTCEVTYDGQLLNLTTKEYELLELLLRDSHHVFSAEEILDRLWSSEEFPAEATVRSHVRRLRQKLRAAGAPHDFITTLHGRGYYLRAPVQETLPPPAIPSLPAPPELANRSALGYGDDLQTDYLRFLNEIWTTTKTTSLEQLTTIAKAIKDLKGLSLSQQRQEQAQQIAHKLAGTLGIFGLTKEVQMARHLEHLLTSATPLQPKYAALLETLVQDLQQEIRKTTSIQSFYRAPEHSPLLLLVDQAADLVQALTALAATRGIRTAIATTPAEVRSWMDRELPDSILLRRSSPDCLELLQTLFCQHPTLPVLVLGQGSGFAERLEVAQRGGEFLLEESVTPEQILSWVARSLDSPQFEPKIMIVDDDQDWLQALPALLSPWGFKITTLADPQQFWMVLQTVVPDALVLDVNMPQINGFELCQVLRSDPHWQRLPVLFLSILSDSKTQNQAFTVGADDYLCKPVMGIDLARRILNRLQRMKVWAS